MNLNIQKIKMKYLYVKVHTYIMSSKKLIFPIVLAVAGILYNTNYTTLWYTKIKNSYNAVFPTNIEYGDPYCDEIDYIIELCNKYLDD